MNTLVPVCDGIDVYGQATLAQRRLKVGPTWYVGPTLNRRRAVSNFFRLYFLLEWFVTYNCKQLSTQVSYIWHVDIGFLTRWLCGWPLFTWLSFNQAQRASANPPLWVFLLCTLVVSSPQQGQASRGRRLVCDLEKPGLVAGKIFVVDLF